MNTIVARVLPDGSLVRVLPDGTTQPIEDATDWTTADKLTDEEIEAAASVDPDAQPIGIEALARAVRGPHPRFVRMRLKLSQDEFCERYLIPLEVLKDWESHKSHPDEIATAYLKAIIADPKGVAAAVAPKPRAAE